MTAWRGGRSRQGTRAFQHAHHAKWIWVLGCLIPRQKKVYRKEKPQWAMTGDSRCQTSPKICVEVWGQTPFAMFTRFGTTEAPLQQCPNTKSFLWWLSTPWRLAKVSPQSNKHAETTLDLLGQHEQHDCLRT